LAAVGGAQQVTKNAQWSAGFHLDVNKTLIMSDGASGKSDPKAMINSLPDRGCVGGSIRSDTSKETRTVDDWTLECVEPCVNNPDLLVLG
jgi:hypothetical protein